MKVLLTGGSGMIGNAILKIAKHDIRVADLKKPYIKAEYLQSDLRKMEDCMAACKNVDAVIHLANVKSSVGVGYQQSAENFTQNTLINLNVLEAARLSGVKKFVFISSVSVQPENDVDNNLWSILPNTTDKYGIWSKRIGEIQCNIYKEQFDMKISIVRLANVYGPHDTFDPKTGLVIGSLISQICSGMKQISVWGNGAAERDFLYVDDCAKGILQALDHTNEQPVSLGSGQKTSVADLVRMICQISGQNPEIVWDNAMPTGVRSRVVETFWAKKYLGFLSSVSIEEGLKKTIEWFKLSQ